MRASIAMTWIFTEETPAVLVLATAAADAVGAKVASFDPSDVVVAAMVLPIFLAVPHGGREFGPGNPRFISGAHFLLSNHVASISGTVILCDLVGRY